VALDSHELGRVPRGLTDRCSAPPPTFAGSKAKGMG
jgi:hypothetical protein